VTRKVLLFAFLGCGGPSTSAPAAPVPSLDVPPLDASAPQATEPPPKAKAPKLDAKCATNDDCEAVFVADDCCGTCAPRIANKTWKRDIEAYCAKEEHHGKCEPMACSWGYSKPRCEKGLCQ
jgi:hypothetical protein